MDIAAFNASWLKAWSDKDVDALAKQSEEYAGKIELVRTTLPGIALVAGFVLLAAGGVLSLAGGQRRGGRADSGHEVERVPGGPRGSMAGTAKQK